MTTVRRCRAGRVVEMWLGELRQHVICITFGSRIGTRLHQINYMTFVRERDIMTAMERCQRRKYTVIGTPGGGQKQ